VPARRALPALLLAGCAAAPVAAPVAVPRGRCRPGAELWAFGADWHTELALPTPGGALAPISAWAPGARVIMVGFGKRDFFMAEPPGLAEWLAAPLPGPAVLRVTALAGPPAPGPDREVVPLGLDAAGRAGLAAFLAAAFARDAAGAIAPPIEPPARGRAFFAARDAYTLAWNCNRWTAEALAAAGLPVEPAGVVTRAAVMRQAAACA
jgi:hypothetical protein